LGNPFSSTHHYTLYSIKSIVLFIIININRYFPRQFVLVAHQREPRCLRPLTEPSVLGVSVRQWTYTAIATCRQTAFYTFLVLGELRNAPAKRDCELRCVISQAFVRWYDCEMQCPLIWASTGGRGRCTCPSKVLIFYPKHYL